jgi:flagellar biogenesis protein FliO
MREARTIRSVARAAGPWRIAADVLALIGVLVFVFGLVFGVFGAVVETQEQRAGAHHHGR